MCHFKPYLSWEWKTEVLVEVEGGENKRIHKEISSWSDLLVENSIVRVIDVKEDVRICEDKLDT